MVNLSHIQPILDDSLDKSDTYIYFNLNFPQINEILGSLIDSKHN